MISIDKNIEHLELSAWRSEREGLLKLVVFRRVGEELKGVERYITPEAVADTEYFINYINTRCR